MFVFCSRKEKKIISPFFSFSFLSFTRHRRQTEPAAAAKKTAAVKKAPVKKPAPAKKPAAKSEFFILSRSKKKESAKTKKKTHSFLFFPRQ